MAATAAFTQPNQHSKYYLGAHAQPSPPPSWHNNYNAMTQPSTTQAQDPTSRPQWETQRTPRLSDGSENYNLWSSAAGQRRQPLSTPAALRPTETPKTRSIPARPRPLDTPPASQGNSWDSAGAPSPSLGDLPEINENQIAAFDQLRRDTPNFNINQTFAENLEEEEGEVTAPPPKSYWQPDSQYTCCKVCKIDFTWYFRRHHCRYCGGIVCANHSVHRVLLDQNGHLHTQGYESKACPDCHKKWKAYKKFRTSRAGSLADSQSDAMDGDGSVSALAIPQQRPRLGEGNNAGSVARSFHVNWSTF